MIIYLVTPVSGFDGNDGFSYALLEAQHKNLLCSFLPFIDQPGKKLAPKTTNGRRRLMKRVLKEIKNEPTT